MFKITFNTKILTLSHQKVLLLDRNMLADHLSLSIRSWLLLKWCLNCPTETCHGKQQSPCLQTGDCLDKSYSVQFSKYHYSLFFMKNVQGFEAFPAQILGYVAGTRIQKKEGLGKENRNQLVLETCRSSFPGMVQEEGSNFPQKILPHVFSNMQPLG